MKRMTFLSLIAIFALSTSAQADSSKTIRCPTVESVQSAPYVKFYRYEPFWMLEKANNFFDTDDEWSLLMMYILADDENDALIKANEAEKKMRAPSLHQHN